MDLLGGALVGALVSEALKKLIQEAKNFTDFKPLSEDLASTMERLIPLMEEIDLIHDKLDFGFGELKELRDTIKRASVVVDKCQTSVRLTQKRSLTKEIKGINEDMRKFCGTELQLLQYRTLSTLVGKTGNLEDKVDGLIEKVDSFTAAAPSVYTDFCSVPKPDNVLVGFDCSLMELKKKLLDVSVVNLVVTAPPGCGKSTLVTHLCHDKEVKEKFKHIFFCVVSSTPNLRVIVQHLLQHNGYKDLTFDNDSQAANALRILQEKLKGDDILLVLDDVWRGAESFLKKFQINLQGSKILVTSRFEFPSFGPTYHLKPLENKDAKNLLIQVASPLPHHTNSDEFEDLLQKILKRCNGFPLIIEVVGISLKGKDLYLWKALVESWSEGEKILDSSSVLERLQPSFSALKPQLKECFMDMGSFLEDQKIRASVIIDIWVELYGKGTSSSSSSSSSIVYLNELASQNLLKLIPLGYVVYMSTLCLCNLLAMYHHFDELVYLLTRGNEHEDGFYNRLLVTQHDILRELAIHQSELEAILERKRKRLILEIIKDTFPYWCVCPINARLLSISTDDLFSSSWVKMDCPNVEALVLNLSSLYYALPSFIARMKKLKVLSITNHGFSPARLRNFQCLSSLPNLKRIRLEKVSITLLDLPQLRLGSLEKISFFMCSFGEVFYDCVDIDISEALPSLQEIDI